MIYRSNLTAQDIQPHFKHAHCRPMPHSFGHDVLSDWADRPKDDPVFGLYKNCGFWTHDEAAILYTVAEQVGGYWLDIGSHTGWTAAHIAAAGCRVFGLEPMARVPMFAKRIQENLLPFGEEIVVSELRSDEWFAERRPVSFSGVVVDGDHGRPCPLNDAIGAMEHLRDAGVILFHDAIGAPVQEGVMHVVSQGFRCKVYSTPHVVVLCWRGEFEPPAHTPDPRVVAGVRPYLGELRQFA